MSEDVLSDDEDAGVKSLEEHGEEVTDNKWENQVNAGEDCSGLCYSTDKYSKILWLERAG